VSLGFVTYAICLILSRRFVNAGIFRPWTWARAGSTVLGGEHAVLGLEP